MRMSLEDFPLPLMRLSKDTLSIEWINLAAQEWLCISQKNIISRQLDTVLHISDEMRSAMERAKHDHSAVSLFDHILQRPGETDQLCDFVFFVDGACPCIMVQLKGNNPLRAQSSNLAVSAMGRMLAHEIKNPLAGIQGAAQLLKTDIETEEGLALIELITSEIARIRRLADSMENFGESGSEKLASLNIHETLAKACRVVRSGSSHILTIIENYDPSLPHIMGDADTMMQAVLNLIKNAAEAIESTGEAGTIRIETAFRSGVTRRISSEGPAVQLPVEIRITDDGPGISEALRHRLFQPFVTSKPAGQGLGLALVSKVALAHGGLVEHRSRSGETVFSILLPYTTGMSEETQDEV